jgi:hypothetical protein
MRLENEVIFTAAARVLPPDEIRALGQEMRARRQPQPMATLRPRA